MENAGGASDGSGMGSRRAREERCRSTSPSSNGRMLPLAIEELAGKLDDAAFRAADAAPIELGPPPADHNPCHS